MRNSSHNIWLPEKSLILASGSQTRAMLLLNAGINPEIIKPTVDERKLEVKLKYISPINLANHLAAAKAESVGSQYIDRVTIGADQVLEFEGRILHKPVDLIDAQNQLRLLQGREHILHSSVAIIFDGKTTIVTQSAQMSMRPLDLNSISVYAELAGQHRVTSSVGGYQLEGLGIHLFDKVKGDHFTILGLPLISLLAAFRNMGFLLLS